MKTEKILTDVEKAIRELIDNAKPKAGSIFLLGGSSSEIQGKKIGSATDLDLGDKIINKIIEILKEYELYLAVQGCEHTNRSLVIERECQQKYSFSEVNVIPHRRAGGAFATAAFNEFSEPVTVENMEADLGIDIGDALIGMHLKNVAVPVRLSIKEIGKAHLTAARTRLKLVGGVRAKYRD
ncbi:MAG: TIGR01440 family protein [Bacillota bacterium]